MLKLKDFVNKHYEVLSYLIAGGLTTVVSLTVYYGCVLTFLNPDIAWQLQCANILSWIAAVTFAYITNRVFVFQSKNKNWRKELIAFYSSRLVSLFLDMIIMFLLVTIGQGNDKIAKMIVQVSVTIVNYLLSKLFVFKGK
ncbi:MAG: GtrA family protein [Lachnospiraceae bacterium]